MEQHKQLNEIRVKPEFRVNQLSLTPGGSEVTVITSNGSNLVYTNVKNPQAYINRVLETTPDVKGFLVNGETVEQSR
jgi:hypothetical protein